MTVKDRVIKALQTATGFEEIELNTPAIEEHGDYSSNVALQIPPDYTLQGLSFKGEKGKSPREWAKVIKEKLSKDKELSRYISRIEIAGPGFINFFVNQEYLLQTAVDFSESEFGIPEIGKGNTVVIDYSAPNIAKPFGIGHLRSTIIGQALYNIYKELGWKVIGDNHLGDWGTQFGKLLYMIDREGLKSFDIGKLEELYVAFHKMVVDEDQKDKMEESARAWFKKLEDGDPKAREIWQKCVDVSLSEFEKIYKLLGVSIDISLGESFYESEMKAMLQDSRVQKHLDPAEGDGEGKIIDLSEYDIKTPLMFLKSDGGTTYATRDLATIKYRVKKWNPDIIVYEVGVEQTLHFNQVFASAKKLGIVGDEVTLYHTKHGLYLSPSGKKFSTRKGDTVKLEEVLSEAVKRAEKLGAKDKDTARSVGIGAIKYFDLKHAPQSDIVFDWDEILNMQGSSGPYLQYTYARARSVLGKAENSKLKAKNQRSKFENKNNKITDEEIALLRAFIQYSGVIVRAGRNYSPNLICNYLYTLAQKFNAFYNADKIIGSENEEFRLILTKSSANVLRHGLEILGIESPEKM